MARPYRYPLELRRRAVPMVAEVRDDYPNETAALQAVTEDGRKRGKWICCSPCPRGRGEHGQPVSPARRVPAGR